MKNLVFARINPICPRVFLSDHVPVRRGEGIVPPFINVDRKNAFDMKLAPSYFVMLEKKRYKKKFKVTAIAKIMSPVMSVFNIFEKFCEKWLKLSFFSKINLCQLEKRFPRDFFYFRTSR